MGPGFMNGSVSLHGDDLHELASDGELEDVPAALSRCRLDSTAST
jgi:hypothetical protein